MEIIHENEYLYKMNNEIEPYLATHRQEGYVPGAEDHLHQKDTGIVGKIHVQRYLAEKPKGVIIISHGFTEAAPKYDEMIYYFLKAGYHVYMPEHMGHGQSYRLTADPSLVHIDTWKRYVRDFLKICHVIKKTYPELPLVLFAHSMGGAIGTIAAAWESQLFQKIILNSPMLRPLTGNVPWLQNDIGKTIRARRNGNACDLRGGKCFFITGKQSVRIAIRVGICLKIGDQRRLAGFRYPFGGQK